MKILKTFFKFLSYDNPNRQGRYFYGVNISIQDNNKYYSAFINTEPFFKQNTQWVNINNLENKDFLEQNKIEYLVEGKENNIIPIGLVDFVDKNKYAYNELNLCNSDGINLHRVNKILENLDRAIQIKYEAIKFMNRLGSPQNPKCEEIEL